MPQITIALTKGRILKETLPMLAAAGIEPLEDLDTSRKLVELRPTFEISRMHNYRRGVCSETPPRQVGTGWWIASWKYPSKSIWASRRNM